MTEHNITEYRLTADRILVRPREASRSTAFGIIIDSDAPPQAEIVAVGPGKKNKNGDIIPLDVKVGDKIIYESGNGSPLKFDGFELTLIKEEHVVGVINNWIE